MYSQEEFDQAASKGKALELNVRSDLSQKIDTEEYSFGYIVGRKLNLPADRIVLAGQDGTRVTAFAEQMRRLLSAGPGTLPPLVLVSYVANDLCGDENFTSPVEAFRQTYKAELDRQFAAIAAFPADPKGTNIMILAPLDVANVLSNEKLLSQKIRFENRGEVTCGDLRRGTGAGGDLGRSMESTLVGACRAILGSSPDPAQRLAQLRALQDAQNQMLEQAVNEFNGRGLALRAQYAPSTGRIDFQPGDLANDCFHPGRAGAARIADQLLQNELRGVTPN
jgi:lysophospholipase L1-like esterase